MQPMARKPKRFPGKIDYRQRDISTNWWESENDDGKNKTERRNAKKEISVEIIYFLWEGKLNAYY